MNAFYISALQHYGYPALWLIVFVAAAGAPISGSLLLFAAGAFSAFGDFNMFILFPVALSAAVLGDNLGYILGRRVGLSLLNWLERQKRFRWITAQNLERGRVYFRRRAAWAIFVTRFLIVALGGPINLLAGLEEYPYFKFLFWDVSGQTLGAIITLGLGYVFAESWEEVASIFGAFSSLVLALVVAAALSILLTRRIQQWRRTRASKVAAQQAALATSEIRETTEPLDAIEMIDKLPPQRSSAGQNSGPMLMPE